MLRTDASAVQAATIAMDTVVSIHVAPAAEQAVVRPALQRALDWFAVVERACSRFDPVSAVFITPSGEKVFC